MGGQAIPDLVRQIAALRGFARECRAESDRLARDAAAKRSEAFGYERRADAAEREYLGREWAQFRPGDVITLRVFGREGWERERREVVAVDWPVLTLRDGIREYDFDASSDPDRDVMLVGEESVGTRSCAGFGDSHLGRGV